MQSEVSLLQMLPCFSTGQYIKVPIYICLYLPLCADTCKLLLSLLINVIMKYLFARFMYIDVEYMGVAEGLKPLPAHNLYC